MIDLNDLRDFLGTRINVGDKIVYAGTVGRSARLTLAEVLEINHPKTSTGWNQNAVSIKVQPLKDSYGHRDNYDWDYDPVIGRGTKTPKPAKPVFLKHIDRLVVIDK